MQTIREVVFHRDYNNMAEKNGSILRDAITGMFHEYADLTQEGVSTEEALKQVFNLGPEYLEDGELSQYFNGKQD